VPRQQQYHPIDQLVQLRRRIGPKPAAPRHDARHHGPEELVELVLGRDRAVAGREDGGEQPRDPGVDEGCQAGDDRGARPRNERSGARQGATKTPPVNAAA
jgi:hypothetical protein